MATNDDKAIAYLTKTSVETLDQLKEIKAAVIRLEAGNDDIKDKLDQVIGAVETLSLMTPRGPGSGSKRRRRAEDIQPELLSDRLEDGGGEDGGGAPAAVAAPPAASAVASGQAPSPPQQNAFEVISRGQGLATAVDWTNCGNWTGHLLLTTCLKRRQDWKSDDTFLPLSLFPGVNSSTARSMRLRAKRVLIGLEGVARADNPGPQIEKYFDVVWVPREAEERREYFDGLTHQLVEGWMNQIIDTLYAERKKELEQQEDRVKLLAKLRKARNRQKTNVSAVGNKMEEWGKNIISER